MAQVVSEFWREKKVFLTGHTGFKGSWLSIWLNKLGANVVGYALPPPTNPSLYEAAKIDTLVESHFGDVRDFLKLQKVMANAKPDIVIHMAAQALVRYSYANPIETYMTNVMGTAHVLEAVRSVESVKAVVNVTTDKCYENKEWDWGYRENEPLGGHDPYSSSKACSELITTAYRKSFFINSESNQVALGSARAGNVIGGGDWATDRLIPDILRALENQTAVVVRNPEAIRPWQHVLEPLSGYLTLAENLFKSGSEFATAYNFGPAQEDAKEVEWIVRRIVELWGPTAKYSIQKESRAVHEAKYLKLDCSKAMSELKWRPVWSLSRALDGIVDWQKAYIKNPDLALEITLNQIKTFEESLRQ